VVLWTSLNMAVAAAFLAKARRKGGRPRKVRLVTSGETPLPPPTLLDRRRRGRPRKFGTPKELVQHVDAWRIRHGRRVRSDAQAIGELLYEHAPPATRRRLDRKLAVYVDSGETPYQQGWGALRKAIIAIERTRFETLTSIVSEARKNRRRNQNRFRRINP
jgi:hypothetical protein